MRMTEYGPDDDETRRHYAKYIAQSSYLLSGSPVPLEDTSLSDFQDSNESNLSAHSVVNDEKADSSGITTSAWSQIGIDEGCPPDLTESREEQPVYGKLSMVRKDLEKIDLTNELDYEKFLHLPSLKKFRSFHSAEDNLMEQVSESVKESNDGLTVTHTILSPSSSSSDTNPAEEHLYDNFVSEKCLFKRNSTSSEDIPPPKTPPTPKSDELFDMEVSPLPSPKRCLVSKRDEETCTDNETIWLMTIREEAERIDRNYPSSRDSFLRTICSWIPLWSLIEYLDFNVNSIHLPKSFKWLQVLLRERPIVPTYSSIRAFQETYIPRILVQVYADITTCIRQGTSSEVRLDVIHTRDYKSDMCKDSQLLEQIFQGVRRTMVDAQFKRGDLLLLFPPTQPDQISINSPIFGVINEVTSHKFSKKLPPDGIVDVYYVITNQTTIIKPEDQIKVKFVCNLSSLLLKANCLYDLKERGLTRSLLKPLPPRHFRRMDFRIDPRLKLTTSECRAVKKASGFIDSHTKLRDIPDSVDILCFTSKDSFARIKVLDNVVKQIYSSEVDRNPKILLVTKNQSEVDNWIKYLHSLSVPFFSLGYDLEHTIETMKEKIVAGASVSADVKDYCLGSSSSSSSTTTTTGLNASMVGSTRDLIVRDIRIHLILSSLLTIGSVDDVFRYDSILAPFTFDACIIENGEDWSDALIACLTRFKLKSLLLMSDVISNYAQDDLNSAFVRRLIRLNLNETC